MSKTEEGMVDPQEIFSKIFGGRECCVIDVADMFRGVLRLCMSNDNTRADHARLARYPLSKVSQTRKHFSLYKILRPRWTL